MISKEAIKKGVTEMETAALRQFHAIVVFGTMSQAAIENRTNSSSLFFLYPDARVNYEIT